MVKFVTNITKMLQNNPKGIYTQFQVVKYGKKLLRQLLYPLQSTEKYV